MVNIYVSNDNGVTYTLIEDSVVNNSGSSTSYSWVVPHGLNSYNCKFKVEETANTSVFGLSWRVRISDTRSVTMLYPNGGEVFNGMDTINLTWHEEGLLSTIEFYFSPDSGATWSTLGTVQLFDTNTSFEFVLPNITTTKALFRVGGDLTFFDESDAVFSINRIARSITITNPLSGSNVAFWGNLGMDFTSSGVANFKAFYSLDSGVTWLPGSNNFYGGPGHYNWEGPGVNTPYCLFKMADADSLEIFDTTYYSVYGHSELIVDNPNGGEVYYNDSTYTISFTHIVGSVNPLSSVDILYSIDGGSTWSFIEHNLVVSTDSTYDWTVPSLISSDSCLIKVVDANAPNNYDISDNFFTIAGYKTITITSPDSTDLLFSDSAHTITWSNTGNINNVNLFYSLDSGITWISIISTYTNTGSYNWNTPTGIHSYVYIKIEDTDYDTVVDVTSRMIMTVKQLSLTITQPNGGEILTGGQIYDVKWDWTGYFDNQWNMYYSLDSGATWNWITDGNIGGNHYANINETIQWTVPFMNVDTTFPNCLIRVISNESDTSDAVFIINQTAGPLYATITSPNGGETLLGGSTLNITWSAVLVNRSVDSVNIHFSSDSGSTWNIVATNENNDGDYLWNVPSINTTKGLLRIVNSSDSLLGDTTDNVFTITNTTSILLNSNRYITIYPNPVHDRLTINTNDFISNKTILDMNGRSIIKENTSNKIIDISDLETGTYLIEITINNKVYRNRFIKQ
jgi:hypothetical protein